MCALGKRDFEHIHVNAVLRFYKKGASVFEISKVLFNRRNKQFCTNLLLIFYY